MPGPILRQHSKIDYRLDALRRLEVETNGVAVAIAERKIAELFEVEARSGAG